MKYVEPIFLALFGSGVFYVLLDWLVEYLRSKKLVRTLKIEAVIDWATRFAVRAAENYGRTHGLRGSQKFSKAVEMARERLLECGLETPEDRLKQTVGAAYEKLRPELKRSTEEEQDHRDISA
jgi:hypothetical protein